jgi:glycosyltransferase involved in cell wall biosynthesis
VVDNYSTDKTVFLAKSFGARVFTKGPERSTQRNFGASKAKGKFLLFLDADMELTPRVLSDCIKSIRGVSVLVIPEQTVGDNFIARIRRFEREMYIGDLNIEVARFFEKKLFHRLKGFDVSLTGPEDYDLHYRASKIVEIKRISSYVLHHEETARLSSLLSKKYYYANKGARYALKHPELVRIQGTILFRGIYLKHWKHFIDNPVLGLGFLFIRCLEMIWAVSGYIHAVGILGFVKTVQRSFFL